MINVPVTWSHGSVVCVMQPWVTNTLWSLLSPSDASVCDAVSLFPSAALLRPFCCVKCL